jgi:ribonuclease III
MTEVDRRALEEVLGHSFCNPDWLERALTHSSRKSEAVEGRSIDNERLEFLGDSVLGIVVSEFLWRNFPAWDAGMLSRSKARLVSTRSLGEAAQRTGLGRYLRLGRGEEKTGGREKRNLLADAYEAVIAAIYLDGGLEPVARLVRQSLLDPAMAHEPSLLGKADHKSALQEWLQQRGMGLVEYRVVKETGPDHEKIFHVEARLGSRKLAASEGMSKKEAEQNAARLALERLEREGEPA